MDRRVFIAALFVFFVAYSPLNHSAPLPVQEYALEISFDIPRSKLIGVSRVRVSGGKASRFRVAGLAVRSVRLNERPLPYKTSSGSLTVVAPQNGTLEIAYEGVFRPGPDRADSRDSHIANVIGKPGIFLGSGWYPVPDRLAVYRLSAMLPPGYVAVSEAEKVQRVDTPAGARFHFTFEHPLDQISLVASDRYEVIEERFHGIDLASYYFPEDRMLAESYLARARRYIELYEKLLLPFPFKRFAVVENFLPTGYSMPTYTLLGQDVMRLPFIIETSLGHEILHQWFGNLVYIDYETGNWAEGLTTYLADHYYQEQRGEGWRYRKQILVDYTSYVRKESDLPLTKFSQRVDPASRAVGYGKTAMVFHMLRRDLGDEAFFGGLRRFLEQNRFVRASWGEVQRAFEDASGKDLGGYFAAWTRRTGLAELAIGECTTERREGAFVMNIELRQNGELYPLNVPLKVIDASGAVKRLNVRMTDRQKIARVELAGAPSEVILDEDFDIARRLAGAESPAVIGAVFGSQKPLVVLPHGDATPYQEVIDTFRAAGADVRSPDSFHDPELQSAPLLILGADNPIINRFGANPPIAQGGFAISAMRNPWNPRNSAAIIASASAVETRAAFSKLRHYGKYSTLRFENGRNVVAEVQPSERGIRKTIANQHPAVVDLKTLQTLSTMVDGLADKSVVYVGENHDNFSHHAVQLEMIRGLHKQTPKIAIGMEMFQRPFQKALDDYTSGAIDERTFLKRSEYFKRWDMEYGLYKPILDFARAHRLPVVALNVRREIVEKVGRGGVDSLTSEEKSEIPQPLDLSDQAYRARLKEVFERHQGAATKNFEFFHQAQILWDETMAESVDRFLKERPDYRIVVLAGGGHLQYGAGIPKRVFRRNGRPYAVVLSDAEIKQEIADFIVFPQPVSRPSAPKLMVSVEERDRQVRIASFTKNSVSEKAGMKVNDVIVSLDGDPVESIADIKVALFFKKPGETVKVEARRSDAGASEPLEFEVKLE